MNVRRRLAYVADTPTVRGRESGMMLSAKRLTYKVSLRIALITLAALLLPLPKAGTDAFAAERTISKLAEGVYLIRHKNAPHTIVSIHLYLPDRRRRDTPGSMFQLQLE